MARVRVYCQLCNNPVDIEVSEEELHQHEKGIIRVMFIHGDPVHAIVIYIDRNFRVRAIECPDSFKIEDAKTVSTVSEDTVPESLSEALGEPCFQALYSYDEVESRERTSFVLDKAVLKAVCESGTICLSHVRRRVAYLEKALGQNIDLKQIEKICKKYVEEGLIRQL